MARATAAWARGATPQGTGFTISRRTFDQIVEYIADNEGSIQKARCGQDVLIQGMVTFVRSEAMSKSFGPVAPRKRSVAALAGRIPVQRITGAYYAGWYIRRLGNARWAVGNSSWDGYLIETGMFQRVRRPILKMSVISMLRYLQTTRVSEQFADWIIAPRRNARGQFQSFSTRMGSTATVSRMAGPSGELP